MTEELPGQQIERDAAGRFKKTTLSSERASALAQISGESRKEKRSSVKELLSESGYDYDTAPEYVRLMAQQAVKSNVAMRDWRNFCGLGVEDDPDDTRKLKAGDRCPRCGQVYGTIWDKLGAIK